jgi:hypothetical protein
VRSSFKRGAGPRPAIDFGNTLVAYTNAQGSLITVQKPLAEQQAYAVSDGIAPQFLYQGVCFGYWSAATL